MRAIRIHEFGGVEKLRVDEVPLPEPGPDEIRVRVRAAGLNYIDIYHRTGLYPGTVPRILGSEVAGTVTAVGERVTAFAVGDRVATTQARGSYAEETVVAANDVVRIPGGIDDDTAAALLAQGITAHVLVSEVRPVQRGDSILVHAAAGGVGLLLVQIARLRGARILATVGHESKAALVREAGADGVCVYRSGDFAVAARKFTSGKGVDVAFDGVGRDTFTGSLNALRPRGMLVSFGNASGPVPPFAPLLLMEKGSLFLTRPTMGDYVNSRDDLERHAAQLFAWVAAGQLRVTIGSRFPLESAADAQRALEGRMTTGKVLLIPNR